MTEGAAFVGLAATGTAALVVAFLMVCDFAVDAAAAVFAFVAVMAVVLTGTTRCGLKLFRGGAGFSSATVNVGDWRLCCCWSDVSLETAKGLGAPLGVDEKTSVNGFVYCQSRSFTRTYHCIIVEKKSLTARMSPLLALRAVRGVFRVTCRVS